MSNLYSGTIFCAGGKKKYIDEAHYAAKTFKRCNPTIPVTLFTDQDVTNRGEFDEIIIETGLGHPQKLKMYGMLHSPYERTLYLDSDTQTCGSLAELFAILDFYNIGFTHRVKCKWPPNSTPIFVDYVDFECLQGGMLLFNKSEAATSFIQKWQDTFNQTPDDLVQPGTPYGDQVVLNRIFGELTAKEKVDLCPVFLPNRIYNARPWMWEQLKKDGLWDEVKVFHARGLNTPKATALFRKFKHKFGW